MALGVVSKALAAGEMEMAAAAVRLPADHQACTDWRASAPGESVDGPPRRQAGGQRR